MKPLPEDSQGAPNLPVTANDDEEKADLKVRCSELEKAVEVTKFEHQFGA